MAVRRSLAFVLVGLLLFPGAWTAAWGLQAVYNRPNPFMDYVPQEIGIFDCSYRQLSEQQCRRCHGDNLAPRHHNTALVRTWGLCTPCHDVIDELPGVIVYKDCTQSEGGSGCHSWDDAYGVPVNGWHHNTDQSSPDNCVACHDPNLVSPIGPVRTLEEYPPAVTAPTPYSCENCHWGQEKVAAFAGFDPDTSPERYAGHPSTYHHVDESGELVGYYCYETDIMDSYQTHHMGFRSALISQCSSCHWRDPNDFAWQYDNPELIRYCERCHDPAVLHGLVSHVDATPGWEAIGFHAGVGVLVPQNYRSFSSEEHCEGCHADTIGGSPSVQPCSPAINVDGLGIEPKSASDGTSVTLPGKCFGENQAAGQSVQIKSSGGGSWTEIPIVSWSDTEIVFRVPSQFCAPGNYWVRVVNPDGAWPISNKVGLTLTGSGPELLSVSPDLMPCGIWLRLVCDSDCFGDFREYMLDAYQGQCFIVDFVSPSGRVFTAVRHRNWHRNSIEVRFYKFFEDLADPISGERNFIQDANEATITKCSGAEHGDYSVLVRKIIFGDEDGNGRISAGDMILDVESGTPLNFDYIDAPYILKLRSKAVERRKRLVILGTGFGQFYVDGEVRIGGKAKAQDPVLGLGKLLGRIRAWTNTKIAVKLKVPTAWQGKTKFVWVERNGYKSNYKRLKILPAQ